MTFGSTLPSRQRCERLLYLQVALTTCVSHTIGMPTLRARLSNARTAAREALKQTQKHLIAASKDERVKHVERARAREDVRNLQPVGRLNLNRHTRRTKHTQCHIASHSSSVAFGERTKCVGGWQRRSAQMESAYSHLKDVGCRLGPCGLERQVLSPLIRRQRRSTPPRSRRRCRQRDADGRDDQQTPQIRLLSHVRIGENDPEGLGSSSARQCPRSVRKRIGVDPIEADAYYFRCV